MNNVFLRIIIIMERRHLQFESILHADMMQIQNNSGHSGKNLERGEVGHVGRAARAFAKHAALPRVICIWNQSSFFRHPPSVAKKSLLVINKTLHSSKTNLEISHPKLCKFK